MKMNLDMDFSVVSRFLRGVLNELRQKRLWPVAVLLLAGVVAVPIVLTKSAPPTSNAQASLPTSPPVPGTAIPTLNVQPEPGSSNLTGPAHDPFAGSGSSASTSTASPAAAAASAASTAGSAVTSALTGGGSSSGGGSASGGGSSTTGAGAGSSGSSGSGASNPPSITPNAHPKPAPTGLSSTQAYEVSLAITNSSGGLNTIDPLERLSVLPGSSKPLLVELGVLQGGKRVLFAVQPGTVVSGPGTCTPGPIDCEILSLGQDQTEALGDRTASGGSTQVALFAVTDITVQNFSSAGAANRARRTASAAGSAVLNNSGLQSLALFEYEPSLGSIVDLRNLTVGDS